MTSLRGEERTEFPQKVRKAAFRRCCRGSDRLPYCEGCGILLTTGNIVFEHVTPDGLGGEPTLENCKVFCRKICALKKTVEEDNPRMQKADRVLKSAFGLQAKRHKIKSAGFRKAAPQRSASRPLSRRTVERQTSATPEGMEAARKVIGADAVRKAFGPGGGGVAEIIKNIEDAKGPDDAR